MKITKDDLKDAAQTHILNHDQIDRLWNFLSERQGFQTANVIYYFGGLLLLASLTWFMTKVWDDALSLIVVSLFFAIICLFFGRYLWKKPNLQTPGGLLITVAVALTPVAIYGFQKMTGAWPGRPILPENPEATQHYHLWSRGCWLMMELGTILSSLLALRFFRFPFLTFPLAFSLWYMAIDLTPLLIDQTMLSWNEKKAISAVFGLLMLINTYSWDIRNKKTDLTFWLYFFGALLFWGGLSTMKSDSELNKFIYCILNMGFIGLSVYLRQKIFLVLGAMGVSGYLAHLAYRVFKHSDFFPIALGFLGLTIIFLGIKYQKNKDKIEEFIENRFPGILKKWRPSSRGS